MRVHDLVGEYEIEEGATFTHTHTHTHTYTHVRIYAYTHNVFV